MNFDALLPALRATFGDRLLACYVTGSHADGSAVAFSDLDLMLIFREPPDEQDQQAAQAFAAAQQGAGLVLDLDLTDVAALTEAPDLILKLGSRFLSGEDIRDSLPLPALDVWARDRLHSSYWRAIRFFERPLPVTLPLGYPNPADEFFGYVRTGNTRNLLRHVTWAATAMIGHLGQTFVARKKDVVMLYRQIIGDGYADYLAAMYSRCKVEWNYQIPDDRAALRALCEATLAFETQFMAVYHRFLIDELQGSPEAQAEARKVLTLLPMQDDAVAALMG